MTHRGDTGATLLAQFRVRTYMAPRNFFAMTRIVIGSGISVALLATTACSGTSPASPSASLSVAPPSTTAFHAQTFSKGATLSTLDHGHNGRSTSESHDDHDRGNGREAQLEGVIASIDAAHTSFVVNGTTVNVLTTTVLRHGRTTLAFADLKVGDRVHVKGAANGKAVEAREVKLQNERGHDDHDADHAEGVVAGLAGTCPAITFTVGTAKTTVTATDKTIFGRGGCAAVVNNVNVEVRGALQADGSILASRVSVEHEEDDDGD